MLAYLRQFEERAEAAGVARNEVLLARYALCTALDEAVLSTPWGSTSDWGKQSLLITVHNEAWGGEKVFQLLDHCLQSPRERLYLLELLYLCMCLGFEGRYRVMVSKPKIAGLGLNLQHCADMAFVGLSDSYEQLYQSIRRCWRFGQTKPVNVLVRRGEWTQYVLIRPAK